MDGLAKLPLLLAQAGQRLEATPEQVFQHALGMTLELVIAQLLRRADELGLNDVKTRRDLGPRLTELRREWRAAYLAANLPVPGDFAQPMSKTVDVISIFETLPYGINATNFTLSYPTPSSPQTILLELLPASPPTGLPGVSGRTRAVLTPLGSNSDKLEYSLDGSSFTAVLAILELTLLEIPAVRIRSTSTLSLAVRLDYP